MLNLIRFFFFNISELFTPFLKENKSRKMKEKFQISQKERTRYFSTNLAKKLRRSAARGTSKKFAIDNTRNRRNPIKCLPKK